MLGLYLAGCSLLVLGGLTKAVRPEPAAGAVGKLLGSPDRAPPTWSVRLASGAEALLGISGAVIPGSLLAGTICICYLVFSSYVAYVRARGGPLASCACFSSLDARPTRLHVVLDLAIAAAAASVAAGPAQTSIFSLLSKQPLDGVPLVASSVLCTWLALLALTLLPRLSEAREHLERGPLLRGETP
jgi:hypothetical protein